MDNIKYLDSSKAYILSQLQLAEKRESSKAKPEIFPFVTISRETGIDISAISEKLLLRLNEFDKKSDCPWASFDKNLIQRVQEDFNLHSDIEKLLPEKKFSEIQEVLEELFGMHPSRRELVYKTSKTILRLARIGNVILIGRGANIITQKLPNGFHVRFIAPLDMRIKFIESQFNYDIKKTSGYIRKEDEAKSDYVKKLFSKDINDPHLYDVTFNLAKIDISHAADIIAGEVIKIKTKMN